MGSMTVAVTGGTGHVGVNLIRMLAEAGHSVRALVYDYPERLDGLAAEPVVGDVLDTGALQRALRGAEVVFHLAAVISLRSRRDDLAERVNVEGTRNVVAACNTCGVRRLVHFSSIHAFSAYPRDAIIDETRALCGGPKALPYDRSKAEGERVVAAAVEKGLDAVIVNPTAVLGPWDFGPSAMGKVLVDLATGKLPALVRGGYNWVDARDVSWGAMAAAEKGKAGEKYLLAGHHTSIRDLAAMVAGFTGTRPPRIEVPMWLAHAAVPFAALKAFVTRRPARITPASLRALSHHQRVSHEKAASELGYSPRPLDDTVRDALLWFERNRMIPALEHH